MNASVNGVDFGVSLQRKNGLSAGLLLISVDICYSDLASNFHTFGCV